MYAIRSYYVDIDIRQYVYDKIKMLTVTDLEDFFNKYIKNLVFNLLILGDKNNISIKEINYVIERKLKILPLKKLFGY